MNALVIYYLARFRYERVSCTWWSSLPFNSQWIMGLSLSAVVTKTANN